MTKVEFLDKLKALINEYPPEETSKSVEYYEEMINDRMEEGMTEAEAIASLGNVEEIAEQIKCELPLTTLVKYKAKEKTKGKKMPVWAIVLIVLGSPIWLSLAVSVLALIISFYATIWSIDISFWAVDFSFVMVAIASLFAMAVMITEGSIISAVIYLGMALVFAALSILFFIGSLYLSKGIVMGTALIFKQIKKSIVGEDKKEE